MYTYLSIPTTHFLYNSLTISLTFPYINSINRTYISGTATRNFKEFETVKKQYVDIHGCTAGHRRPEDGGSLTPDPSRWKNGKIHSTTLAPVVLYRQFD